MGCTSGGNFANPKQFRIVKHFPHNNVVIPATPKRAAGIPLKYCGAGSMKSKILSGPQGDINFE